MMNKPITTFEQAVANIKRYNEGIEKLADFIPYARAWYALPTEQGWLFGPSKFIGYQDLDVATYAGRDKEIIPLDGRITESILQQWADLVEVGNPLHTELYTALSNLCARFGKKPNSLARISVVRTSDRSAESLPSDELVALLAAVYRSLTPIQKTSFRKLAEYRSA